MSYYHQFASFCHIPKNGETLREFIDWDACNRAKAIQRQIQFSPGEVKEHLITLPDELVKAMPVNVCVYVSNYSVDKNGFNAPPIVAKRMGCKVFCDDEYSFYGTYGDWLVHISSPSYAWIGELEYPNWEICNPDLITYDNYDYAGGD